MLGFVPARSFLRSIGQTIRPREFVPHTSITLSVQWIGDPQLIGSRNRFCLIIGLLFPPGIQVQKVPGVPHRLSSTSKRSRGRRRNTKRLVGGKLFRSCQWERQDRMFYSSSRKLRDRERGIIRVSGESCRRRTEGQRVASNPTDRVHPKVCIRIGFLVFSPDPARVLDTIQSFGEIALRRCCIS